MLERIPDRFFDWLQSGLLGSFGGAAFYVYMIVKKGGRFSWVMMALNLFLAVYVGTVLGEFLPPSQYRDGILMASGFVAWPILNVLEKQARLRMGPLIERIMQRALGPLPADKDGPEA